MAPRRARTRKSLIPSYTWLFYGKVVTEVLRLDPLKTEYKNIKVRAMQSVYDPCSL
jgi:hypothetical protein